MDKGVSEYSGKVAVVYAWPTLKLVKNIQSFIGLV